MMRAPLVLAALMLLVLGYGLATTLQRGLEVAPRAAEGVQGRLHLHMKNVTRFGGSAADVALAVRRAVLAPDGEPQTGSGDWRALLRSVHQVAASAGHAVVLPSKGPAAERWALPGGYWAAYSGAPVLFASEDGLEMPGDVSSLPRTVYVLAPDAMIPDAVLAPLRERGEVVRIAAADLASHAVRIAEYRDERTGFGWGRTHDRRTGYFEYVVAAPSEALAAWAALPLTRTNATTLLFADDDGGVPAATDRYIWMQRADWFTTPSEGPFRHIWIVGDRVSYAAQARLDLAPEKSPYLSLGELALGPMEALLLVFMALGFAGAIFVVVHGQRLLPDVMVPQRIAWAFTALLLPVAGVVLYLAAYRRPRMVHRSMTQWVRPASIQAAAATAMGFGFGAPLMIVVGYALVYFGFPLFFGPWANGWWFVFGAGMPIMMALMYVGAVLLAWPFVQVPMAAMMRDAAPPQVMWRTLGVTALSMAAVSLGMMTTSWWMLMSHSPMMPKEDDVLWFGSMWLASSIGFLVAWPLNLPMVRTHLKSGAM